VVLVFQPIAGLMIMRAAEYRVGADAADDIAVSVLIGSRVGAFPVDRIEGASLAETKAAAEPAVGATAATVTLMAAVAISPRRVADVMTRP
jgi:hypothetical protein